eukprot:3649028-Rhodomonas_salina.1
MRSRAATRPRGHPSANPMSTRYEVKTRRRERHTDTHRHAHRHNGRCSAGPGVSSETCTGALEWRWWLAVGGR